MSRLRGNGRFGFAVVGESHRQSELEEIVGGRTEEGAEYECTALLVPEPDNAFDQNAIMVFIEAQKRGYASRGQFREARADERPLFIGITSAFVALQHVSGYHTAVVVGVMLLFALSDIRQPSSHQGIGWRAFCSVLTRTRKCRFIGTSQQRTAVTSLSVLACAT